MNNKKQQKVRLNHKSSKKSVSCSRNFMLKAVLTISGLGGIKKSQEPGIVKKTLFDFLGPEIFKRCSFRRLVYHIENKSPMVYTIHFYSINN